MVQLADASAEAPALGSGTGRAEDAQWRKRTAAGWQAGATEIIDTSGRKNRCVRPVSYAWTGVTGLRQVAVRRCMKCEPCGTQKRSVRVARTMHEVDETLRTWAATLTTGWENYQVYLEDLAHRSRRKPLRRRETDPRHILIAQEIASDTAEDLQKWFDRQMQRITANMVKRARRRGARIRQSTNWERHESEQRHAHTFLHEIGEPLTYYELVAATHVMPRGRRHPRRRPGEGHDRYWRRVCRGDPLDKHAAERRDAEIVAGRLPWHPSHGLFVGFRRWRAIRDERSDGARSERLLLPVQLVRAGRKAIFVVRDNRRRRRKGGQAISYATKFASYSAKEGGRWSASPNYGGYPGTQNWGAASVFPAPCRAHSGSERCRGAASRQELGPNGPRSIPPKPPSTAPPVAEASRSSSIAQSWVEDILLERNRTVHQQGHER